jgi:hypothetical protein
MPRHTKGTDRAAFIDVYALVDMGTEKPYRKAMHPDILKIHLRGAVSHHVKCYQKQETTSKITKPKSHRHRTSVKHEGRQLDIIFERDEAGFKPTHELQLNSNEFQSIDSSN